MWVDLFIAIIVLWYVQIIFLISPLQILHSTQYYPWLVDNNIHLIQRPIDLTEYYSFLPQIQIF